MKAIVVCIALLWPTMAAAETFYDGAGRVVGKSRSDSNGATTFYDGVGRVTGKSRLDSAGATTFYDRSGRVVGRARR